MEHTSGKKGIALFITRILIVAIFLWHGIPKAFNPSVATEKFVAMGFPGFLGPIVGIVEVVAAIFILIGFWHKRANIVLAIIIAVAVIFVHAPKGVTAGLERDLLIIAANIILIVFGPGAYAMKQSGK